MKFKPYPNYKPSSIERLGNVPSGWKVKRLKQVASVFPSNVDKKSYEDEPPVRLCNYTDVYYNDTITADLEFMVATASPEQIAKFTLRAGDTIITKDSETADDIAIAAYVPNDIPGVICGYHLAMVRPLHGAFGGFIKRFFDSNYAKSKFATLANGLTRVGLGQYALDNVELPFPPYEEQVAIASFLDRETAKIDTLIVKQEKLIELLKEKRQAVISHAVTKGLDPSVPMKPSGVEWLGDVPEHWRIERLAKVAYLQRGYDLTKDEMVEGSVPVVTSSGINGYHNFAKVAAPGVVTGRYGSTGNFFYIEHDYWPHNTALYVKNFYGNSERFIFHMLSTLPFDMFNEKAAVPGINRNDVHRLFVAVPPFEEQKAIVCHIEDTLKKIALLISKAESAIRLQKEHRTALISAAVTGKINVREAVSDLQEAA